MLSANSGKIWPLFFKYFFLHYSLSSSFYLYFLLLMKLYLHLCYNFWYFSAVSKLSIFFYLIFSLVFKLLNYILIVLWIQWSFSGCQSMIKTIKYFFSNIRLFNSKTSTWFILTASIPFLKYTICSLIMIVLSFKIFIKAHLSPCLLIPTSGYLVLIYIDCFFYQIWITFFPESYFY